MSDGRTTVGFDGSASAWRALDWATARVARRGGALEVVQAVDTRFGAAMFGPHFDLATSVDEGLREAEAHVRALAPGVQAGFRWVDGPPAAALLQAAEGASLLVVGTDKRPGAEGARVGSLPLKVAAKAGCTVAVVPDSPRPERDLVVVGVDHSSFARSALALAVSEASWLGAQIEAVHAWDVPETFQRALDAGTEVDPAFLELQEAVIAEAIADVPVARSASITPVLLRRNPAAALVERATGAAELIVGTRGRGRFAASLLGSVSHDVLLNLPCPVLVTPKEYSFTVPETGGDESW